MPLKLRAGENTLEAGRGAGSEGFNHGGRVLSVRNVVNKTDNYVKLDEGILVVLSLCW